MRVVRIDHINIAGPKELLDRCVRFYTGVLGLTVGFRPQFSSHGYWLYAGDASILHLTEADSVSAPSSCPLNHVAFACEGPEAVQTELRARGIPFTIDRVVETGQVQLFLHDPAGLRLELNFSNA